MSIRVESPPIGRSFAEPIVIAIVVALGIGALFGAVVTKAVNESPSGVAPARTLVATPASTPLGDAQKPEAMTAKPSITRPTLAIEDRVRYKLEAMEGRELAAQAGAEDPLVKPHLPKRSPRG